MVKLVMDFEDNSSALSEHLLSIVWAIDRGYSRGFTSPKWHLEDERGERVTCTVDFDAIERHKAIKVSRHEESDYCIESYGV